MLLGRDRERQQIDQALARAQVGMSATLVLAGEPGIGKTVLLGYAAEHAGRMRLLRARGVESEAQIPFGSLLELLRPALEMLDNIPQPQAAALEGALALRPGTAHDRFAVGAATLSLLAAYAEQAPVAVLVDDAQWLDGESLRALHGLTRDLSGVPVLLLLAVTPQPAREELDQLRAQLGRDIPGTAVTLEPLGPAELRALSRWAMPGYTDVEVDRLARRLAADSAGLPLLAVELLHAVALGLDLHHTAHAWPEPQRTLDQTLPGDLPEAIVAAVRIGFRRLSKNAQLALSAAAVLGGRAAAQQLARATELAESALHDALDELEWQRWLAADGRGYSFVARLAGQIVERDMITPGQKSRFLERLGS